MVLSHPRSSLIFGKDGRQALDRRVGPESRSWTQIGTRDRSGCQFGHPSQTTNPSLTFTYSTGPASNDHSFCIMDPSLLHSSTTGGTGSTSSTTFEDLKPFSEGASGSNPGNGHDSSSGFAFRDNSTLNTLPPQSLGHASPEEEEGSDNDEGNDEDRNAIDGAKRPRLRLAHACDRCRKRKIRCDTQQPCGPCQATRNQCTFNTPSRRVTKPKASGSENRSSSTSGVKRPHSPPGSARIAALGGEGQANLEARLAALEAMLGDVPPKVHNAFLSSLDARLGSGGGVGITQGKGEGVSVALEALAGGDLSTLLSGMVDQSNNGAGPSNGWQKARGRTKTREDPIENMAKKMEGMSFFYEDEIGQAKWQGELVGQIMVRC